jgi:hypothetical protein
MLTVTDNYGLKSTDICFVNMTLAGGSPPQAVVTRSQQTDDIGSVVTLDGSESTAKNGIASFQWHQVSGAPVTLLSPVTLLPDPMSAITTFSAVDGGEYGNAPVFRLIVKDKVGMRSRANAAVTVH